MSTENETALAPKEETEVKAYAIGTISISHDGVWHCHYIGHQHTYGKTYFGNGSISHRNIRKLLAVLGSRLNNKQAIYVEKIKEVENAEPIAVPENPTPDSSELGL